MTADDVLVVTHDPRLNPDIVRGRDGEWLTAAGPPIRALARAELSRYDVGRIRPGTDYAASFRDQEPRDGAIIPALADVLRIDRQARFIIELKTFPLQPGLAAGGPEMADAVVALARRLYIADRITVQSFDWRGPRHLRRSQPDIRLAWLTRSDILAEARQWWDGPHPADFGGSVPRAVAAEGGPVWAPDHTDLTQETVEEAHALGLGVVAWTVNRPDDMLRLIGWGVDGLITDRPDLARALMAN